MANSRSLQGYRAVISLAKLDELVADFGIAPAHVSAVAFVILMLSGFSAPRCEATVYDSDGSEASVRALHNIAHDGDTITLSDALPFGRLWYTEIPHAIGYAKHLSRSHDAVIRVYDDAGSVIETHQHAANVISVIARMIRARAAPCIFVFCV